MRVDIADAVLHVFVLPRWAARVLAWAVRPLVKGELGAVCLGHVVLACVEPERWMLYHEAVHARQSERYWCVLGFWWAYLLEHCRHGYRFNRFEIEARAETERAMLNGSLDVTR